MDTNMRLFRYKYRDCNPSNLKIITEGTLYFSSPTKFNDPFDSSPAYDLKTIDEIYKRRPDLIKRVGDSMGLSPAKRLMKKTQFIANARRCVESGEWAKSLMSTVGVFCMSRNPCSPLMWAHYAKDHSGFVVEFKIDMNSPRELLENIIPFPVNYCKKRPILDWAASGRNIEDYLLTKSPDWEYEEEERILEITGGPGVYPYSREHFLSSVIVGVRTNPDDLKLIRSAAEKASADIGRPIPIYQARLSNTDYKVYIPDHPAPLLSSPR